MDDLGKTENIKNRRGRVKKKICGASGGGSSRKNIYRGRDFKETIEINNNFNDFPRHVLIRDQLLYLFGWTRKFSLLGAGNGGEEGSSFVEKAYIFSRKISSARSCVKSGILLYFSYRRFSAFLYLGAFVSGKFLRSFDFNAYEKKNELTQIWNFEKVCPVIRKRRLNEGRECLRTSLCGGENVEEIWRNSTQVWKSLSKYWRRGLKLSTNTVSAPELISLLNM